MRSIAALTTLIFFLIGQMSAFAAPILSTNQKVTTHIEYVYSPYGVAISANQITVTITETTDENGKKSTTITTQTSVSTWKGGSLKVEKITGTSDTESDDGATSQTDFETNYTYDEDGRLKGALGGSSSSGNRGKDANGQDMGTFTSNTVNTHIIKNGEALNSNSQTTGTNYGPDGTKTSDYTETTTYEYQLIGGDWVLVKEISTSNTNGTDGSSSNITKTRTYQRDANGVCTGISQTASGTMAQVNQQGGRQTYTMKNYKAEFKYDPKVGWYLSNESWDWES